MLTLEVITPKQVMLNIQVDQVTLPGEAGELGILSDHIRLLTSLKSGLLTYTQGSRTEVLAVHFGFAEVNQNVVTVLANQAELSAELDAAQVAASIQQLESQLQATEPSSLEAAQVSKQLAQAKTQLAVIDFQRSTPK